MIHMPKHIMNVIAWRRPDFLRATLIRLAKAHRNGVYHRINVDHEPDDRIFPVIRDFSEAVGSDSVEVIMRGPHHNQGPTRNIVHALHESLDYEADYIHSLEDDVFINHEYFLYHESGHFLAPDAFSVTAYLPQPPAQTDAHNHIGFLRAYAPTVAVSYRADKLAHILAYMPLDYPDDMIGHNARTFPDHPCAPHEWAGIDGTLGRVLHKIGGYTVYPMVNRAYHAGYISAPCAGEACGHSTTRDGINNGPHRHGSELEGTIEERALKLLAMKAEELNALSHEITRDYVWTDLDADYGPLTQLLPGVHD